MGTARYTRTDLLGGERVVRRAGLAADLPAAAFDIFNITVGCVLIKNIFGRVTTIIAGAATPVIQFTPTGGGVLTPLCAAAASIDTDAVNTLYCWDGLAASQLIPSAVIGGMGLIATSRWAGGYQILVPGVISITNAGAAATGIIDWYVTYISLPPGGIIAAA